MKTLTATVITTRVKTAASISSISVNPASLSAWRRRMRFPAASTSASGVRSGVCRRNIRAVDVSHLRVMRNARQRLRLDRCVRLEGVVAADVDRIAADRAAVRRVAVEIELRPRAVDQVVLHTVGVGGAVARQDGPGEDRRG